MDYSFLDSEEYKDIYMIRIKENNNGLPFFIRKYIQQYVPRHELHRHEYMQINYIFRGKRRHKVHKHEFDIMKGDIFVMPPYVPHLIIANLDSEIEIFEFKFIPGFINQGFELVENARSFLDFAYIEPFLVSENQIKPRLNQD
ncbi:MAG: AraC family ligand binding domain-containing protein [Clostridiales bacterium]|nr:AraC family ligand binding domain-containing protein [Clostridiales bacterium]